MQGSNARALVCLPEVHTVGLQGLDDPGRQGEAGSANQELCQSLLTCNS